MGSWVKAAAAISLSGIMFLRGDTAQIQRQSQEIINTLTTYMEAFTGEEVEEIPFTTDVHYCRDNLDLLENYYPEIAEELIEEGELCVEAPAPPGAIINNVPHYNQCEFQNTKGGIEGLYVPCASGCGPAAVKMALEFAGKNEQDIYSLWDLLWTGSISGTTDESIERVLSDEGVFGGQYINLKWEALQKHIERGDTILFHIASDRDTTPAYENERYCGSRCPKGGHHALIVGMSDDELIIHDPFTSMNEEFHENGEYLVVSRDTLEDKLYARWNLMTVVVPDGSHPDEVVETPDGAYFDYFPTGWPEQLGKGFGERVWWQAGTFHTGTDWFGRLGEDIYAMESGTVVGLGCLKCAQAETATTGYGLTVALYHGDIEGVPIYSMYSHLDEARVEFGDEIKAGEVIGTMGNTGFCYPRDAYHLHISVSIDNPFYSPWNDYSDEGEYKWIDPGLFLGNGLLTSR